MKTLVLNVDRDDDFGRKTQVKTPIIGYEANLKAAVKLGEVDPEDSDLNAIFTAISTFKYLKEKNEEVEIATICGDIKVGYRSDMLLAKQLDAVIEKTSAEEVIFVSDGAEDEYIIPIIQSRIRITSVKRVSIKQAGNLEDTYYRFLKLFSDEKIQKQFVLPLALVLIVWAFFVLLDITSAGFGAILLTLGCYLLIRVFKLEKNIKFILKEIKSGFVTGKLSFYTYIISVIIVLAGVLVAYTNTITAFNSETQTIMVVPFLYFLSKVIFAVVLAILLTLLGRIIDVYVRDKKLPWDYWMFPFSILAFGSITYALSRSLYQALIDWPNNFSLLPFTTLTFIGFLTTGIMIAIVGAVTNKYIQEIKEMDKRERDLEIQAKLLEKS